MLPVFTPSAAPIAPPAVPRALQQTPAAIQHAWRAWYANRIAKNRLLSNTGRDAWYAHKSNAIRAIIDLQPDPTIIALGTARDDHGQPVILVDLAGIGQCSWHVLLDQSWSLKAVWPTLPCYPFQWIGRGRLAWPRVQRLDPARMHHVPTAYHASQLSYAAAHERLVLAGLSPALLQAGGVQV